jgi:hypothetical protein
MTTPEEGEPQPLGWWMNRYPVTERWYYDFDNRGYLSDDERDEDGDGLTNYDELHGRLTPAYWDACYSMEAAYLVQYAGTSAWDPDSDGDGLYDGVDDQDHDDIPNVMELSRMAASGLDDNQVRNATCRPHEDLPTPPDTHHEEEFGQVHPFSPCLPDPNSRTCQRHRLFDDIPAPFDAESPYWYSLN